MNVQEDEDIQIANATIRVILDNKFKFDAKTENIYLKANAKLNALVWLVNKTELPKTTCEEFFLYINDLHVNINEQKQTFTRYQNTKRMFGTKLKIIKYN